MYDYCGLASLGCQATMTSSAPRPLPVKANRQVNSRHPKLKRRASLIFSARHVDQLLSLKIPPIHSKKNFGDRPKKVAPNVAKTA